VSHDSFTTLCTRQTLSPCVHRSVLRMDNEPHLGGALRIMRFKLGNVSWTFHFTGTCRPEITAGPCRGLLGCDAA